MDQPKVKTFDMVKVKDELKYCPKIIQDYVKSLNTIKEIQNQTIAKAINKLKEPSHVSIVMRSLQEKKMAWTDRLAKYELQDKQIKEITLSNTTELLLLTENIKRCRQIIADLEEIINQNFA